MSTITVDVREAQSHLLELLSQVKAGAEVVLTDGNMAVARLVPVTPPARARLPGLHAGTAWISDDFDAPLPDAFWVSEA